MLLKGCDCKEFDGMCWRISLTILSQHLTEVLIDNQQVAKGIS